MPAAPRVIGDPTDPTPYPNHPPTHLPKQAQVHINTLPETKYTWHEFVKRVHPPPAGEHSQRFQAWLRPGGKPTCVDLHYKVCWAGGRGWVPVMTGGAGSLCVLT